MLHLPRCGSGGLQFRRGVLNRLDDVHVARAAAQVAGDRTPDLCLRRRWITGQQRLAAEKHARRAEAAL